MKILIINSRSHTGSTGKIAYGAFVYFSKLGHEVKMCCCGAREEHINNSNIICLESYFEYLLSNIISRITGLLGYSNKRQTKKIFKVIDSFEPDVVQLYNLHGYYLNDRELIEFLKSKNIPTLYTMFDEYAYMGRCCFSLDCNLFKSKCGKCPLKHSYPQSMFFGWAQRIQKEKENAYKDFNNLHFAGVKWVCDRAKSSSLLRDRIFLDLEEPINYDTIFYPRDTGDMIRRMNIQSEKKIIVMVGEAATERKGGIYFVELAKKFIEKKDYIFVFVGYNRNDWEIPSNMITVGLVYNQDELAYYYSLADIFVCTSLADTTPNTCLEAMGCGSPILGFNIAGVPYCAEEPIGTFVEPRNVDALCEVVSRAKKKTPEVIKQVREYAYKRFSENNVYSTQMEIYKRITNS